MILSFEAGREAQVGNSQTETSSAAPPASGSALPGSAPSPRDAAPPGRARGVGRPRGGGPRGVGRPRGRGVPAAWPSGGLCLRPRPAWRCSCPRDAAAAAPAPAAPASERQKRGMGRGGKQLRKMRSFEFRALRRAKPLFQGFAKPLCREEVITRHAPPLLGPRVVGVLSRPS